MRRLGEKRMYQAAAAQVGLDVGWPRDMANRRDSNTAALCAKESLKHLSSIRNIR